eukprot:scaffold137622_cov51-Phaeocystis_antarctica.AAC.1
MPRAAPAALAAAAGALAASALEAGDERPMPARRQGGGPLGPFGLHLPAQQLGRAGWEGQGRSVAAER